MTVLYVGDLNLQLTMCSFADASAKKGEAYVVSCCADGMRLRCYPLPAPGPKFPLLSIQAIANRIADHLVSSSARSQASKRSGSR